MKQHMIYRVHMEADYLIEHKATIKQVAEHFGLNRNTVKRDLSIYLKEIDESKYKKVLKVFEVNGRKQCLKAAASRVAGASNVVIIECGCTTCKWNNAPRYNAQGFCTRKEIKLVMGEVQLKNGDWKDTTDCKHYSYMSRGEEFRRSIDEA